MTYLDFWNSIPMEWKNYFCNTLDVLAEKQGRTKYIVKDSEDNFFTIEVEVDNSFNGKNFVEAVKFSYMDYDEAYNPADWFFNNPYYRYFKEPTENELREVLDKSNE